MMGPAFAEPETPEEEENTDESFAKSLLGKSYTGDLDIEGWTNFGGGLVSPPIYVSRYQREDGTSLVLTSKLSRTYVVTDALIISKPWKGYAISIACTQGDDFTLRFIGDTRGTEQKEWWTEVRRAWEIALEPEPQPEADAKSKNETEPEPGKITKAKTKGIKCTNPNW